VAVPGHGRQLNTALERTGRVADFLELAELMCVDALDREESCGAQFRTEYQQDGEARRNDADWAFCSAWDVAGPDQGAPAGATHDLSFTRNAEPLSFRAVPLATRSYK